MLLAAAHSVQCIGCGGALEDSGLALVRWAGSVLKAGRLGG
jgi:hypothetical protein